MFDWITSFIQSAGYIAIFLLMLGENIFPPIPSEIIMPLAGFTAAKGDLNIFIAILAGTAGSVAGTTIWYYIGRWLGMKRLKSFARNHGRWLTLTPQDLDGAQAFFNRHSGKAVFLGRLIPGVRTLISVPAGITGMALGRFLIYSSLGSLIWTAFLAGAGYLLQSQYNLIEEWLNPVTNVLIGAAVIWYLYRVITFRPKSA